jgi:hypothetical protein
MAKRVFDKTPILFMDETEVELGPLKIKFLREFMSKFKQIEFTQDNEETIEVLTECALVCMKQHYPIVQTIEDLEDLVDLPTVYKILEYCAGIKIDPNSQEEIDEQAKVESENNKNSWEDLDLPMLESQIFDFGAWKNFEELEESLTMPELTQLLEVKRDNDYRDKKFMAALKGIDLDKQAKKDDAWEKMKAKVFSGGVTDNPDDILSFRGYKAEQSGFGIGMGLDYVDMKKPVDKSET